MPKAMQTFVDVSKEARTWIILVATVLGTQGVSALVVPQYAQDAAQHAARAEVESDVSGVVVSLAKAHNNHAEHIEALQEAHRESEALLNEALSAAKARNEALSKRLAELSTTLEALVLIHGERTVARYARRVEEPAAADLPSPPEPAPPPVVRVKIPERAKRLPVNYAEIQQQLKE